MVIRPLQVPADRSSTNKLPSNGRHRHESVIITAIASTKAMQPDSLMSSSQQGQLVLLQRNVGQSMGMRAVSA